jgi:decaprenylphospho-beta-D-erythro-pentofuranosid-2-ulose 2-reductase
MKSRNILIIGATSVIAHHCARIWALEKNTHFFLIGRNIQKLIRVRRDLELRGNKVSCEVLSTDLSNYQSSIHKLGRLLGSRHIDTACIALGDLSSQKDCSKHLSTLFSSLVINSISPVIFIEFIVSIFEKQKIGNLIIFGSVAGDRIRKSNYTYGSSKGFLELYAQGLRHRFFKKNIFVSLVKIGPTKTAMTSKHKNFNHMNLPSDVAEEIVKKISLNEEIIYAPAKWRLIMFFIKNIPNFIFNRINI